ncbi:diaminobutyrate--2-oxoglutarate aminotransferase [Catenovulum agarivorans DS-2]|uniref:Diaminobutyrate--2-oxoglutarate aminotransferase n=1 Tax=Catenovulum agarivorans DS-2 TaxID=1328313 RepID=W7R391_9ALTE|nr:aspartate aminotransferase family protein [Catenovulum agarivorans]EWH12090.1 diaminobutyrate--2-oxoglutarate aminotransferase [Catenovulum agarivorans DS-2]
MSIFTERESDIRAYCRVYDTVFKTAQNAIQTDEQGKTYIDFFAGAGVLNFGHNNSKMKQAIIDYLNQDGVTHSLDMHTTAKREFIQAFCQTILEPRKMPHKLQFMGPTGTNAVETALKLARRVTQRQDVVAFSHGFHGMTLGALACTANEYFRGAAGVPLNHVNHYSFSPPQNGVSCVDLAELRAQYQDGSSGIKPPAAFIVEVIQAEGGVNVAQKIWLQELQKLAKDFGALFIIDDIQVGCGRTGSYFSFDDLELDPDIICLAKGIGGFGTPLAMNLVKPEYDKHWSPGEHTGTFRGQCLSFVAGKVALNYFKDNSLMEQVQANEKIIQEKLAPICEERLNRQLRGKGMIWGVDLADGAIAKEVVAAAFEQGLLVSACGSGGRVIKVIPPLTIEPENLHKGLDILVACCQAHS